MTHARLLCTRVYPVVGLRSAQGLIWAPVTGLRGVSGRTRARGPSVLHVWGLVGRAGRVGFNRPRGFVAGQGGH